VILTVASVSLANARRAIRAALYERGHPKPVPIRGGPVAQRRCSAKAFRWPLASISKRPLQKGIPRLPRDGGEGPAGLGRPRYSCRSKVQMSGFYLT
jgi:hypothetical protein